MGYSSRSYRISHLLTRSKDRMVLLEESMRDRVHLVDSDLLKSLIRAKRIIGALEKRIEQLHACAASGNLRQGALLLNAELEVPSDTVHALMESEAIAPLPSHKWAQSLEKLLGYAERKAGELDQKIRKSAV